MKTGLTIHTVNMAVRKVIMAPEGSRYCWYEIHAAPLYGWGYPQLIH